MRFLLTLERAAMRSTRAPLRPWDTNSARAASRIFARLASALRVVLGGRAAAALAVFEAAFDIVSEALLDGAATLGSLMCGVRAGPLALRAQAGGCGRIERAPGA